MINRKRNVCFLLRTITEKKFKKKPLTSAGEENLDGHVLQQVPPREDRPNLGKVPFSMEMVAVLQNLKKVPKLGEHRSSSLSEPEHFSKC